MRTKRLIQILLGLSIVGWLNALFTLWHRNKLLLQGQNGRSFCNINSFVNCDAVAVSDYSSFAGFPTAAYGMIFYSIVFILCVSLYFKIVDDKKQEVADTSLGLVAIHIAATVPTLGLAALSLFKLNSLCLMCLATYIINLIMLIISFKLYRDTNKTLRGSLRGFLGQTDLVLGGFLVASLAIHLIVPKMIDDSVGGGAKMDDPMIQLYVERHLGGTPHQFTVDSLTPVKGPENAPITVVEFSDFQCPFCATSAATMPTLLKAYEGKIRYIYKNFPLSSECNAGMKSNNHPLACAAAKAGLCVFKNKGAEAFFEFKEQLFAQQSKISQTIINAKATSFGIDQETLNNCVKDAATHNALLGQTAEGAAREVQGTPAIFVNGKIVESGPQPMILKAIFNHYLSK